MDDVGGLPNANKAEGFEACVEAGVGSDEDPEGTDAGLDEKPKLNFTGAFDSGTTDEEVVLELDVGAVGFMCENADAGAGACGAVVLLPGAPMRDRSEGPE